MRYTLVTPITAVSGKLITELNLRDHYTVGDVLWARSKEPGLDLDLAMIARVGGLDAEKELTQLDMRDADAVLRHVLEIRRDPKAVAAEQAAKSLTE